MEGYKLSDFLTPYDRQHWNYKLESMWVELRGYKLESMWAELRGYKLESLWAELMKEKVRLLMLD